MRLILSIIIGGALYFGLMEIAKALWDIQPTFVEAMAVAISVVISNVVADIIRGKP